MPYPEIKADLIKTGKSQIIVAINTVDGSRETMRAAELGCASCPFYMTNVYLRLTMGTRVRCAGVGGLLDVNGRGGTNIGKGIQKMAVCGINPTEVRRKHFHKTE